MVLSKLNKNISFPEIKQVDPNDATMEATLYEIEVDGLDVVVAVGKENRTYIDKNVVYFPIYLVKPNDRVVQIGVYELNSNIAEDALDENGELDIELLEENDELPEPLIYVFATKELIKKSRKVPDKIGRESIQEKEEGEYTENRNPIHNKATEYPIPDIRKDIFTAVAIPNLPIILSEESDADALKLRKTYKPKSGEPWVATWMKNKNYDIIDNEGGGDCFFATIRDAFAQIGHQTTVNKLREKLSSEANDDIYMGYKMQYDMAKTSLAKDLTALKTLESENIRFQKLYTETLDRNEKKQLIDAAKQVREQYDRIKSEKRVTEQLISEFKFMKGVDTLEKFRAIIKTCEFWAETWAISTIERILNIKFILLSSEAYKDGDMANILQCGQLNDILLETSGVFNPEFYLILDYLGDHYKLVEYKSKHIFSFQEIPYDIKKTVVDKCMERNAGVFSLIPDFKGFKESLKSDSMKSAAPKFEELSEAKIRGLYNDNIVFVFYDRSSAKPLPGKGSGEKVDKDMIRDFSALHAIPNWRQKLDDSWTGNTITLNNQTWSSIEHYYQASKFKESRDFYLSFSLESGTELSKNVEMAKAAGSKNGKYNGERVRPVEITIDSDFYGKRAKKELYDAQMGKFSQNDDLKRLLIETKLAKLMHYRKGKEAEFAEDLVMIRGVLVK